MDLAKEAGYGYDLDVSEMFHSWEHDKDRDILTYRDISFASKFTKTQSPIHHSTFMTAMDDSMQCFLASKWAKMEKFYFSFLSTTSFVNKAC